MNEKEIAELLFNAKKDDNGRFINIEPVPNPDYCSDIVLRDLLLAMSVGDDFRIKPELQYVPYDASDKKQLIGTQVITEFNEKAVIVNCDSDTIRYCVLGTNVARNNQYVYCLAKWKHLDGSVFGKLQEVV